MRYDFVNRCNSNKPAIILITILGIAVLLVIFLLNHRP